MTPEEIISVLRNHDERVKRLEAQVYALQLFATRLAAANPFAYFLLRDLPEVAKTDLMYRPMPEERLDAGVEELSKMLLALAEWRLGMATEDVEHFGTLLGKQSEEKK